MIITLMGEPTAKSRHRTCIRHGKIHSYDTQGIDKTAVAWRLSSHLRAALQSNFPEVVAEAELIQSADAYFVDFEFHVIPPLSLSTVQRSLLLWFGQPIVKPDLDNLVKFYLDAGNKILWSDDKKIVELKAKKIYSEVSQTIITVSGKKMTKNTGKIEGILGLFPPNRYHEMLSDIKFLAEIESIPNRSQQSKAADAAYIISRFADAYSDELRKIKQKYPGYWQDCVTKEFLEPKGKAI